MFEPMADTIETMLDERPTECAVMVDVNCRPHVVATAIGTSSRLERVLAHADVVKVSDEDLALLASGQRATRRRPARCLPTDRARCC